VAKVRTAFFFRHGKYVRYDIDPSTGAESVDAGIYPRDVSEAWTAMPTSLQSGFDAVLTWPNGYVFFFKGPSYVRLDTTNDTVDASIYPRDISDGWPAFPASFAAGVNAAINWGDGRAFFFKGSKYIMYDIENDTVDAAIYPRDISDGWPDFPASFASGIDAAVNWGNGTAYFFKGPQYLAYDIGTSAVLPGYPLSVTEPGKWPGLVATGFTASFDDAIEWPQADVASATIPANLVACVKNTVPTVTCGGTFAMRALFTDSNPSIPACAEYRQFVRGRLVVNGTDVNFILQERGVPTPVVMRPRPGLGSLDDNFREDGMPASKSPFGADMHYGHRDASYGNRNVLDLYLPFRRSGGQYEGRDIPGFTGPGGSFVTIDVDFRGQLIDLCNGGAVLQTSEWTVNCQVP
jgi:hypothetical protein